MLFIMNIKQIIYFSSVKVTGNSIDEGMFLNYSCVEMRVLCVSHFLLCVLVSLVLHSDTSLICLFYPSPPV